MVKSLVHIRNTIGNRLIELEEVEDFVVGRSFLIQVFVFVITLFARIGLEIALFIVSIPLNLLWSPQQGFVQLARRKENGEYIDSYTSFIRRQRMTVAASVVALLLLITQLYVIGVGIIGIGTPEKLEAYTSSATLNPVWDITGYKQDNLALDDSCDVVSTSYACYLASSTSIYEGTDYGCLSTKIDDYYASAMKFDLSSIPDNATITNTELIVYVSNTSTDTVGFTSLNTDTPDTLSCTAPTTGLYDYVYASTNYTTASNWNTLGSKTYDLGATADSNVQARLTTTNYIGIGIKQESGNVSGMIYSTDNASNKPQLRISYTAPAQAPTAFAKGAITTSSIVWTWTDNATEETRYDVHDGASGGSPVTGCTNLAANTQTCTETGLSANTQYTRHPNATDPQGNTDGSSASAYTSIETPTGVSLGSVTTTGMTATATGTISNLTSGFSGLYFQESVTSTNSGWTQTNSWAKSGLTANSQYSFQAKAQNGDANETSLTAAATKYTLSASPNVSSTRSTSTWYTTGAFPFTNSAGWGAGGVQYYRYVWDTSAIYSFAGSENTWSDADAKCPGGACTTVNTTLSQTATVEGDNWYLHVQSFNGENVANGSGTNYGPYYFNSALPTITNNQSGDTTPRRVAGTTYNVDFSKATSGPNLDYAQYAVYSGIGKTGTLVKDWTNIFTDDTASYDTNWPVDFANLTEGLNYVSVKVVALDTLSAELDDAFTVTRDTAAPTFSSFVAAPTASTAVVSWTTNEPATTQLEWGTTTSYGSATTLDATLTTTHSVTLTGLANTTTYHVRALGTDQAGNSGTSADLDFTTASGAHTYISNVQVTKNSPSSVTVTWATNEPATSKVRYGTSTDYGFEVGDATLVTSHSVALTGLTPGTTYHYEVISVGSTTDHDADATFTTATEAVVVTTITSVRAVAGETVATISWTTNKPATSMVHYGTTTEYTGAKSSMDTTTSHSVQLTGLSPGTTYHYMVVSVGSTAVASRDFTFVTSSPGSTTNRAVGPTITDSVVHPGTAPSLELTGATKGNQTIRVYVDGKAVKTVRISGNSGDSMSFTLSLSLSSLSKGKHSLYLQSTDAAGRTSRIAQKLNFTINGTDIVVAVKVQAGKTYYVVQKGDSLWKIARNLYGDGREYTKIVNENSNVFSELLTNPHSIHQGMTLVIP